jgi:hypothetical protein
VILLGSRSFLNCVYGIYSVRECEPRRDDEPGGTNNPRCLARSPPRSVHQSVCACQTRALSLGILFLLGGPTDRTWVIKAPRPPAQHTDRRSVCLLGSASTPVGVTALNRHQDDFAGNVSGITPARESIVANAGALMVAVLVSTARLVFWGARGEARRVEGDGALARATGRYVRGCSG